MNILFVEDNPADLEITLHQLKKSGFEPSWTNVITRDDYLLALEDLPDIILADYTLPGFNAVEALKLLKARDLDIPFIVVSGTISEEVAVKCMKLGASDYLLKDRLTRLGPAIEQALEQKKLRDEQIRAQAQLRLLSSAVEQSTEGIAVTDLQGNFLFVNQALAAMHGYTQEEMIGRHVSLLHTPDQYQLIEQAHHRVLLLGDFTGEIVRIISNKTSFPSQTHISLLKDEDNNPIGMVRIIRDITDRKKNEEKIQVLLKELKQSNRELAAAYDETLEGWVRFLDLRDNATEGHTQRVTRVTLDLAEKIGYSQKEIVHLRRGALLHDIGKMGIPDEILQKPGPLDENEWKIMRKHPEFAFKILAPIEFLRPALEIPQCHHEKWDGSGYPNHLTGDHIPLSARLFAIVDVWDALNSDRPYRKAWPAHRVKQYIKEQSGVHFDPEIVPVFLDHINEEIQT